MNSTRYRIPEAPENGEISQKYGQTLIKTLRQVYGPNFAPGCNDGQKLSDALATMHDYALSQLVEDHERGKAA
jgi:hypothetical protein